MRRTLLVLAAATVLMAGACGGDSADDPGGGPTAADRPSSPAKIGIDAPKNGAVVKGEEVQLKMSLEGGEVVEPTEREVTPTTGHIHVELDGAVVSMDYGLKQTLKLDEPGTHTVRVEFVAADHLPFDPRVFDEIAITSE